jgi:hypothetical protein
MKNILCLSRWGDGKKPDEIKKEGGEEEKKEEEEEEDEGEPDPNDMSIPVGTKKLMRRCFNPVTGHTMPPFFCIELLPVLAILGQPQYFYKYYLDPDDGIVILEKWIWIGNVKKA